MNDEQREAHVAALNATIAKSAKQAGIPEWSVAAAIVIDTILARAVRENTKIENGFFNGVSVVDIAKVIVEFSPK